jgi:hypothetical protein
MDPVAMVFGGLVFVAGSWAAWTAARAGVSIKDGVVERRGYASFPIHVAAADVVGVRVVAGEGGSDLLLGSCQPALLLTSGGRLTLTHWLDTQLCTARLQYEVTSRVWLKRWASKTVADLHPSLEA